MTAKVSLVLVILLALSTCGGPVSIPAPVRGPMTSPGVVAAGPTTGKGTDEPVQATSSTEVASTRLAPSIPTLTPELAGDAMQVSACHKTVASPTFSPGQVLYFRVDNQGWYRTADWFLTSEWIAPYGALSRDLKYLVTFDCGGPGTICVAAPPASQPRILSAGYGLDRASAGLWLPDSQWLVFTTSRKTPPGQWDVRLNALDLGAERVLEITRDIGSYEVSPAGNCIAFTAFEEKLDDFQFQLALLGSRGAQQVWQAPADAVAQVIWPRLDESIAWSGDGNLLAFFKYRARVIRTWDIATGRQRVYDIDLKGKGPAFAENLRWSPDGKKLYFESLARQHWVLDLVREQPRLISTAHSSILGQPLMYQWLPDNRRMIVPELDGSVILDVETGDIQRLSYPGSDKTRSIDDLFW